MPVPTQFSDLSTTAASNSPADTEQRTTADDYFRQAFAFIRGLYEGQTAGQIQFPATQNASSGANVLDDYEEGTWTPTVTSAAGTITAYTADGNYTKVGNRVTASVGITITTKGTATNVMQVSLPFASSGFHSGAGVELASGVAVIGWVENSSSTLAINKVDGTTAFTSDGDNIILTLVYRT